MELKTIFAQDGAGNVIPLPRVHLYLPGGTTPVAGLKNAAGEALPNPFTGTAGGQIQVAAPDGDYIMRIQGAGRDYSQPVRFIDASKNVAVTVEAKEAAVAAAAAAAGSAGTAQGAASEVSAAAAAVAASAEEATAAAAQVQVDAAHVSTAAASVAEDAAQVTAAAASFAVTVAAAQDVLDNAGAIAELPQIVDREVGPRVTKGQDFGRSLDGATAATVGRTFIFDRPLTEKDTLISLTIRATATGAANIVIGMMNEAKTQFTPISVLPVTIIATGVQDVAIPADANYPDHVYPAGAYPAFHCAAATIGFDTNVLGSPAGQRLNSATPVVNTPTGITNSTARPAMKYNVTTVVSAQSRIASLERFVAPGKHPPASPGNHLYMWRASLARLKAGLSNAPLKIALTGSSSAGRPEIGQNLFDRLAAARGLPLSSYGRIRMASDYPMMHGASATFPASWTYQRLPADVLTGMDGAARQITSGADIATWTGVKFRHLKIYTDDSAGVLEYRIDGGAWNIITAGGTNAIKTTTHPVIPDGNHTIEMRRVSGTCRVLEMYATNNSGAGIEINLCGQGSTVAADHAPLVSARAFFLAQINPDIIDIWLSRNDWVAAIPPATFAADVQTLIASDAAACPTAGFVIVPQPETSPGGTEYALAEYRDAMVGLSAANPRVEYLSVFDLYAGTFAQMDALGLFLGDGIHQSATGADFINAQRIRLHGMA